MEPIIEEYELTMSTSNSTSYDNLDRTEMLWNNKIELLIRHWSME